MTMTQTAAEVIPTFEEGRLQDTYIPTSRLEWLHWGGGIEFKILRVSPESGTWVVMFKCPKGSAFPRHKHLGAGEYLMISGVMELRGGEQAGGVTAREGDYGYESLSVYHDWTYFPEDSVLYFVNHGPILFLDAEGEEILFVVDWQSMLQLSNAGGNPRE